MANFYVFYPVTSGNGGVQTYANFASLPGSTSVGALAVTVDTGILYEYFGGAWIVLADPTLSHNPVTIGTANGLSINGSQVLSLAAATTSITGALTSTDFNTFNNKQNALGYTPENVANKGIANGYAPLDAGNKVPVAYLPNSIMEYLGTWSAATNTPTLTNGSGDPGDVYINTTVGTVNFGAGPITFAIGDWVVYNGSIWQKSINSNSVVSVNGFTGAVVLTTTDVAEGTNLYFTNPRAVSAVLNTVTTGGVFFGNGTNAIQNAANFFWDNTNARLGIGTNAPTSLLHISKSEAGAAVTANIQNTSATAGSDAHVRVRTANGGGNPHFITSRDAAAHWSFGLDVTDSDAFKLANSLNLGTNTRLSVSTAGVVNIANLTASRALTTDASKNLISSATTDTELGFVSGVTSSIQTQLNAKQATGSYITALTGDATATGPGSAALTLATVNSNVGSFGTATNTATITVNAKGLVTAASNTPIQITQAQVTNLTTDLAAKMTNPMTTLGDMIYGGAAGVPTRIGFGGNGDILQANGSAAPTWVTPQANATASSVAARNGTAGIVARYFAPQFNTIVTAGGTTTLTNASFATQTFTGTTTQTVVMPVNNTIQSGMQWWIKNRSTGVVTVNSSGGNLIKAMQPNSSIQLTLRTSTLDTTAAPWDVSFTDDGLNIFTTTSSVKTPVASDRFSNMTGNSLTLPIGTYEIFASVVGQDNGSAPGYNQVGIGIYGANGADTATIPTLLSATSNLTINSHDVVLAALGIQYYIGSGTFFSPMGNTGTIIVTTTASVTIFAVPYMGMTTPANSRITVGLSARRLY